MKRNRLIVALVLFVLVMLIYHRIEEESVRAYNSNNLLRTPMLTGDFPKPLIDLSPKIIPDTLLYSYPLSGGGKI
jgi:hypothetical protein